ncbi:HAD family hydrolase [Baekduia sp.]|uniref:HAD family hydrolase n=1 Tax=Baekduia sp. TaxID=2600305 RepID=UPI0039C865F6
MQAVLFDVAGTLTMPAERSGWLSRAAAAVGLTLGADEASALGEELEAAGRPGGPYPATVPPELAAAYAGRDLDPAAHRAAYVGLLSTVVLPHPRLAEALYEDGLDPAGWTAYPDAAPVLASLRARGIRTAAVSNVGFDIRPALAAVGVLEHLDACVLSYEVGAAKPDPAIFRAACAALDSPPHATLMVGDHPSADGGATALGIRTLLLPMSRAGEPHGLDAVLALATS